MSRQASEETEDFQPEMGQVIFGFPGQSYAASSELEDALGALRSALNVLGVWGTQGDPFANSGAEWRNETFHVVAYDWGLEMNDDAQDQPYNFKWRDVEVSWYKHFGRGMSVNRKVNETLARELFLDCLRSVLPPSPLGV